MRRYFALVGSLSRPFDHTTVPLAARALAGRSAAAAVPLSGPAASSQHASLRWTGAYWEVRDLGSTNGTTVDGQALTPGEARRLRRGAELVFGDDAERWLLEDDTAPAPMAEPLGDGPRVLGHEGLLVLPTPESPVLTVYRDGLGQWWLEEGECAPRPVHDGEVLRANEALWQLCLPHEVEGTPRIDPGPTLASVGFCFVVSPDEETVELELEYRGRRQRIDAREHGYVLLTLARARSEESQSSPGERGWLDRDQLLDMLRMDVNMLDVAVYRARRQLAALGVVDAHRVVEVRRGLRRFGSDRVSFRTSYARAG